MLISLKNRRRRPLTDREPVNLRVEQKFPVDAAGQSADAREYLISHIVINNEYMKIMYITKPQNQFRVLKRIRA